MLGTPQAPGAAGLAKVYTPSASGKRGVCSQIICCPTGGADDKIRVAISAGDDTTIAANEWIAYDRNIAPGDDYPLPVADYIPYGYSIVVYSLLGTVSFRACGFEEDDQ